MSENVVVMGDGRRIGYADYGLSDGIPLLEFHGVPGSRFYQLDDDALVAAGVRLLALKAAGLTGSMGRVGACGDNAAAESFFALFQKNVLDRQQWATRDQLRAEIIYWIEATYHRRRRQARLGRLTPIEFETVYTPADQAA